ncbi:histone H3.v1-like [Portunus trituberculatus]|uniref:histone H3.v1-like n=1 Tax=Portunus trituberculatus TaxID=210409 RepID=UPI001E1CC4BD|nr:histone H3.v1-like [Portunus trituberculatus]
MEGPRNHLQLSKDNSVKPRRRRHRHRPQRNPKNLPRNLQNPAKAQAPARRLQAQWLQNRSLLLLQGPLLRSQVQGLRQPQGIPQEVRRRLTDPQKAKGNSKVNTIKSTKAPKATSNLSTTTTTTTISKATTASKPQPSPAAAAAAAVQNKTSRGASVKARSPPHRPATDTLAVTGSLKVRVGHSKTATVTPETASTSPQTATNIPKIAPNPPANPLQTATRASIKEPPASQVVASHPHKAEESEVKKEEEEEEEEETKEQELDEEEEEEKTEL